MSVQRANAISVPLSVRISQIFPPKKTKQANVENSTLQNCSLPYLLLLPQNKKLKKNASYLQKKATAGQEREKIVLYYKVTKARALNLLALRPIFLSPRDPACVPFWWLLFGHPLAWNSKISRWARREFLASRLAYPEAPCVTVFTSDPIE